MQAKFHGKKAWTLPPSENLVSQEDLPVIQLMLVLVGNREVPRIVMAARYNLPFALEAFLVNKADD
eukprot:6633024-Heterocapsa_arctica.AAC.1